MKKWIFRIGIASLVLLIALIVFVDILHDYPEKFEIKGMDANLFKVDGQNASNCYILSDSINRTDASANKVFLIGFRFKLDYVSVKREHLWDDAHSPNGALGHLDTIKAFDIFNASDKISYNDGLIDASRYKYFYKDSLDTWEGHHSNQQGCYEAQVFKGLSEFTKYYNANADKYNMVSWMTDYHLFRIDSSLARLIINSGAKVALRFTDGKVIEEIVRYKVL